MCDRTDLLGVEVFVGRNPQTQSRISLLSPIIQEEKETALEKAQFLAILTTTCKCTHTYARLQRHRKYMEGYMNNCGQLWRAEWAGEEVSRFFFFLNYIYVGVGSVCVNVCLSRKEVRFSPGAGLPGGSEPPITDAGKLSKGPVQEQDAMSSP